MSSDEELCRRVADIVGPSSAASLAIFEMERRQALGEDVTIIQQGKVWLVGPPRPDLEGNEPNGRRVGDADAG